MKTIGFLIDESYLYNKKWQKYLIVNSEVSLISH